MPDLIASPGSHYKRATVALDENHNVRYAISISCCLSVRLKRTCERQVYGQIKKCIIVVILMLVVDFQR